MLTVELFSMYYDLFDTATSRTHFVNFDTLKVLWRSHRNDSPSTISLTTPKAAVNDDLLRNY